MKPSNVNISPYKPKQNQYLSTELIISNRSIKLIISCSHFFSLSCFSIVLSYLMIISTDLGFPPFVFLEFFFLSVSLTVVICFPLLDKVPMTSFFDFKVPLGNFSHFSYFRVKLFFNVSHF